MQEPIIDILSPARYDWSEFQRRSRGFITEWCAEHDCKRKTLYAIVNGDYRGGTGPRIRAIIVQALREGLIVPLNDLDEAA